MSSDQPASFFVEALYPYNGSDTASLSFHRGDIIEVLTQLGSGWWDGVIWRDRVRGWFPSNFVRRISREEAEWARQQFETEAAEGQQLPSGDITDGGIYQSATDFGYEQTGAVNPRLSTGSGLWDGSGELPLQEPTTQSSLGTINGHADTALAHQGASGSSRGGWIDWVPRVTPEHRIYYVNMRTGEQAAEMPAADEDLEVEGGMSRIPSGDDDLAQFSSDRSGAGLGNDEDDALAFFDEHGFGQEQLLKGGIAPFPARQLDADSTSTSTSRERRRSTPHSGRAGLVPLGHGRGISEGGSTVQPFKIAAQVEDSPPSSAVDLSPSRTSFASDASADDFIGMGSDLGDSRRNSASLGVELDQRAGAYAKQNTARRLINQLEADLLPPRAETLDAVEERIFTSLITLLDAAGPLAITNQLDDEVARERLAGAAKAFMEEVRGLLQATSQLDHGLAAHVAAEPSAFIAAAPMNNAELKPVTRRVTTEISKLFVAVRAIWALMATPSPALSSDDPSSLSYRNGSDHEPSYQDRRDYELKLRRDSEASAEELSMRLHDFFRKFRSLVLAVAGPTPAGVLSLPRHINSHFVLQIESLLLVPGIGIGGASRGLGFLPSPPLENASTLSMLVGVAPIRHLPTTNLNAAALDRIAQASTTVHDRVAGVLHALASFHRDQDVALRLTAVHRLRSAGADAIQALGTLLDLVEDLDIGATIDIDTNATLYAPSGAGAVDLAPTSDAQMYASTLQTAYSLLGEFMSAKQNLLAASARLVQLVQFMHHAGTASSWSPIDQPSPTQPPSASPLTQCGLVSHAAKSQDGLGEVSDEVLRDVERVQTSLRRLSAIAGEQKQAAPVLRRQSLAFRAAIREPRRSESSLSSLGSGSAGERPAWPRLSKGAGGGDGHESRAAHPGMHNQQSQVGAPSASCHDTLAHLKPISDDPSWGRRDTRQTPTSNSRPTSEVTSDTDRENSARSPNRSKINKFFGDDKAEAAARARVPKPSFMEPDYEQDDISFNLDNQVKAGTLRALVVKLTSHEGSDVGFLRIFLLTYRTFTTSRDFLDLLIKRYHIKEPVGLSDAEQHIWTTQKQKVVKLRVINVIRSWIESYLSDDDWESILDRVTTFAREDMADSPRARQIILTCDRRRSSGPKRIIPTKPPGNPPPPILSRNTRKLKFLDINALEMARQLTLFESKLFCRIEPNECLAKAWSKEFEKDGAPNIRAISNMANSICRWVAETILTQSDAKKRANTIKHFINIAERCRMLNNFSTLIQIIVGLNSTPVCRLRRTWESVTQKYSFTFTQLNNIMEPTRNYAAYREMIRSLTPPCVPFLGIWLTDWTFIGDGNPDNLREKPDQINFNKRQKAADLILQIQSYQSMPYQLTPVPAIAQFIEESLESQPREESELFDLSLELEPKERDDEKIARLLSESGFL